MTAAPWWTTIAAALAGGVLALFATVLTTIAANYHASRRMKIELLHKTYLEREKALYESRLSTYTELMKQTFELGELESRLQGRDFDGATGRQAEPVEHALRAIGTLAKFKYLLPVISGEEVMSTYLDLMRLYDRVATTSGDSVRFPPAEATIWERLDVQVGRLLNAIRQEIGSDLDMGISAATQG